MASFYVSGGRGGWGCLRRCACRAGQSYKICHDRELGDGQMRKQYVQADAEGGAEVMIGGVTCGGWGGKRSVKLRVGGMGVRWEGQGRGAGDRWDFSIVLTTIRRE